MARKEITPETVFAAKEKIKEIIIEHSLKQTEEQRQKNKKLGERYRNEDLAKLKPFEFYLLILGERSTDYSYTPEIIYENISYFKDCWKDNLSAYKALEFFSFELDNKNKDEKHL